MTLAKDLLHATKDHPSQFTLLKLTYNGKLMSEEYYVYIMTNKSGTLYTGVTNT